MLEQTRRQGASIILYLIFGVLIIGFVINFTPFGRGRGAEGGCNPSAGTSLSIDGASPTQTAFRVAYSFPYNNVKERERVYLALDQLIRRELLARAATEAGLHATDKLFQSEIIDKHGAFYIGGMRLDFTQRFYDDMDGDLVFRKDRYNEWVGNQLKVSSGPYTEEQARSMQASMMAELISGSVQVSRDEALADFIYSHDTVTYDAVTFDAARYAAAMQLTDADIQRFLTGHAAEVLAAYTSAEKSYKGRKPELAIREIFIPKAVPPAAKPDETKPDDPTDKADKPPKAAKADDKKPGDKTAKTDDKKPADKTAKADDKKPAAGEPAKPLGLPIEAAKAKLEAIRAQIAAGKLTFVDAEKQLAADAAQAAPLINGDRGWQQVEQPVLGETVINDAIKPLKAGEMTSVITTELGVYLLTATAKREGDLSYDQVKLELAKNLARDVWSKEAAKRAALDALAQAQGKNLGDLFEKAAPRAPGDDSLRELLENPNIPEDQKQQILRQLLQQRHGSLETHEVNVPVAWGEDSPAGSSAAPAAGSAAPVAPATGSAAPAAPAAGSATPIAPVTGSAAPATPAAGSAAPAAAPAPAADAVPPIAPSSDVLPKLNDVRKPRVERNGPTPRQESLPGIGRAKGASHALFDELTNGMVAKRLYETDTSYVLIQLIEHTQPNLKDFDKTADADVERIREARGRDAVEDWLKNRCDALTKANKIHPSSDLIREVDDKGNPAPTVYRPCMTFAR